MKIKYLNLAWLVLNAFAFSFSASAQVQKGAYEQKSIGSTGEPILIKIAPASRSHEVAQAKQVFAEQLHTSPNDQLALASTQTDNLGITHDKYQQYFKGLPVEHALYTLHNRRGIIESMSGDFARIPTTLDTNPTIAEKAALGIAISHVGARRYMWEEADMTKGALSDKNGVGSVSLPSGKLVVVHSSQSNDWLLPRLYVLAWKFDIYAIEPRSRAYIYVNAHTGQIALQDDIIKHATGTFATRYSGTKTSNTESYNGGHRLRDVTRGQGVETFNCLRTTTYWYPPTDFTDNDNNWTSAEHDNAAFDNAALDAHWGAQSVYDYWLSVHGRNSYDGAGSVIRSYVHYGVNVDNAEWTGAEMLYGDGGSRFRPLTALDVCAHEIGHAICQTTANLAYTTNWESGALNEGFSDIWGAAIENHVAPNKQTWLIGEEITLNAPALRSLSDPNQYGRPSFYRGQNWSSTGAVHTNSNVLSHWFYILSVGKSGTNEAGVPYNVSGIGIANAARIAYRAESVYLYPESNYSVVRDFTIQAAWDIYGEFSPQAAAVAEAWRAVGVGRPYANNPVTFSSIYSIGSRGAPGMWLNTVGSAGNAGTSPVIVGSHFPKPSFAWQIVDVGNSQYRIINLNSDLALTPSSRTIGSGAIQSPYFGYDSQKWQIIQVGNPEDNSYKIINVDNGGALELIGFTHSSNGQVVVSNYVGTANQHWVLLDMGTYKITNVNSGLALQWDPNAAAYYNPRAVTQGTYTGGDNQQWHIRGFGGEACSIGPKNGSPLTLAVEGAGVSSGQNVQIQTNTVAPIVSNLPHQRWLIYPYGGSTSYLIINDNSGMVLDVGGASAANNAPVIQGFFTGAANQLWRFEHVGPTFAPEADLVPSVDKPKALSLFPNPASTQLSLSLPRSETIAWVKIADMRGVVVASPDYRESGQVDISGLTPGIYIVTVSDGKQEYHQRFVKQ